MRTVTVDAAALRQILEALSGPSHLIRELQVTRGLSALGHKSPIDSLIDQYNEQADAARQPESQSARDTWRVVPLVPTTGMLVAGNHGQPGDFSASKVWADMLDAAERSAEISYLRPRLEGVTKPSTGAASK